MRVCTCFSAMDCLPFLCLKIHQPNDPATGLLMMVLIIMMVHVIVVVTIAIMMLEVVMIVIGIAVVVTPGKASRQKYRSRTQQDRCSQRGTS